MNGKNLLWIGVIAALAACNPFEETKGGTPRVLSVMATGGTVDDGGATTVQEGVNCATAPADETRPTFCPAPTEVEQPWVIRGTTACELKGGTGPDASTNVSAANEFVVFVKANKLLDGFTIEQAPNTCVPFGVTDATQDTPWFTVTATSGTTPIVTLGDLDDDDATPDVPVPEERLWYSCYYPSTSTTTEGASVVFYRAATARDFHPPATAENPAPGPDLPGDLTATGNSWFDVGTGIISRPDDRTTYLIKGNAKDKGGVDMPIQVELRLEPDAGLAAFDPSAIGGTEADPTLDITFEVGDCTDANATYTIEQLVDATNDVWAPLPTATDVTAGGTVTVTTDLADTAPPSPLVYNTVYTFRLVETIVGAETTETFKKVATTDGGTAEFSQVILFTPLAPTFGTPTANSVAVNWAPVAQAASYRVQRAVVGGEFVTAAVVPAPAPADPPAPLTFTQGGLDPATTYRFRIIAQDAAGHRSLSGPEATVDTAAAPTP